MNYEELLILHILVYIYFLSQSCCGTCKDILNMCTQIILKANWLQRSCSDRKMCTAPTSPSPVPSLGRENYPAIPNLPMQDRSFAARGRGAVSLGNLPCGTLRSMGSCGGTSSLGRLPWPGSEGMSSLREPVCPSLSDTWSELSGRRGEERMPWPAISFLNAGFLLNVCFQQASRQSSSPEVWNSLSGEIYVSLPKGSAFLLGKTVLYDLPKQSQLRGIAQAGRRFCSATDEKIRKAQFEQLAHSQFCKSVLKYSVGCFNCYFYCKLSALQELQDIKHSLIKTALVNIHTHTHI